MSSSADADRAGLPARVGNYRIDERLGTGGMGAARARRALNAFV